MISDAYCERVDTDGDGAADQCEYPEVAEECHSGMALSLSLSVTLCARVCD